MAKPKVVVSDAQRARSAEATNPGSQQLVVTLDKAKNRTTSVLNFVIIVQMLALAYLVFCIASMVPQARAHFVDVFLHPDLSFFLAR